MSTVCPYDVGAPRDWLAAAGLASDSKACAVPLGLNCGMNDHIIRDCCVQASSNGTTSYSSGSIAVCALPQTASNATYQAYENCILNYPGRDGGFRCNDPLGTSPGPNCDSLQSVLSPPITIYEGTQACVSGSLANTSSVFQKCCGNPAVAFSGGCWQYCVGPANQNLVKCISDGLTNLNNGSYISVGCFNGTARTSGASSGNGPGIGSTLGLIAVLAWSVGFF